MAIVGSRILTGKSRPECFGRFTKMPPNFDPKMLEILACPKCESRPPLTQNGDWLVCELCQSRYPILNGIPRLLVEDAQPLKESPSGSN